MSGSCGVRCHAARQNGRAGQPRCHSCQQWPPTRKATGSGKTGGVTLSDDKGNSVPCCSSLIAPKERLKDGEKREKERKARKGTRSSSPGPRPCTHRAEHRGPSPAAQGASREAAHLSELRGSPRVRPPAEAAPSCRSPRSPPARHCPHCHTPPQPARPGLASLGLSLRGPGLSSGEPCTRLSLSSSAGTFPLPQLTHFLLESRTFVVGPGETQRCLSQTHGLIHPLVDMQELLGALDGPGRVPSRDSRLGGFPP